MSASTVFISYSHKDEAWKNKLLPQLEALRQAGVGLHIWHDRLIDGGDKWYPEIHGAMADAAAAVLLVSKHFLASPFCIQEELPELLKLQEEKGMLLIPVLLRPCPWRAHRWLKDRQMLPRDGKCVAIDFAGARSDVVFAAVAEQVLAHFERLVAQPGTTRSVPPLVQRLVAQRSATRGPSIIAATPVVQWRTFAPGSIDLTRLPETGSALFGRDQELALLDEAWASKEQSGGSLVRVLAFNAQGGVGKSTLVNHWLAEMARDNYRGAARVFGWSFYSQGVRDQTAASADSFIDAALRFFGDSDPTAGSAWDKGGRLASLIGNQRTLIVLDGMEPLQSPHEFERGKLRDPALESMLRGLARHSEGLCLITTREALPDLAGRQGVETRDLEQITPQAARALLRTARVVGTDVELESLAERFGPHALAVSLLGVYLYAQPGHGIGPAQALEQLPGAKPIDRVLAGFEQWLGESPEREALRLLGFFDRPADAGCLGALRQAPAISGLNERLADLTNAERDRVLDKLEKLRLIHVLESESGRRFVDAHPLIREHFAEVLREGAAWREGHRRLYEHLRASTQEGDEPTLEDLQPLYQAVAHGCHAGLQQETCDEVYSARIQRGQEGYSTKKLAAYGSDLAAVACFFEQMWSRLSPVLTEPAQAWLMNEAATRLRALGRLTEALEPMRLSAPGAGNLSELELTLGEVAEAEQDAAQSVTYANRSGDAFEGMVNRAIHADALHQAGRRAEAETLFREAEQMQAERQPDYPLLYSVAGFKFCDLLLAAPERAAWRIGMESGAKNQESELIEACRAVSQRAAQTLDWWMNHFTNASLLDIPLHHLTLGRAALYSALLESPESCLPTAVSELNAAVDGLRRARTQHHLPFALLTRAWVRCLEGRRIGPGSAQEDLDEAWEIAERGSMKLHLADIHLYRARLFGAGASHLASEVKYPWVSPETDLEAAAKLIESCGYGRRKEELADARLAILG